MSNDFINNSMHLRTSSRSAAKATTTSTRLRQCPCTATPVVPHTLSPDRPTLCAFTSPCAGLDTTLNGSSGPPLMLPEPSLSMTSTLLSPFAPERPRDIPLQSMTQFTAPPVIRCSKSMQRARTDADPLAAQISSFNFLDFNRVHYVPLERAFAMNLSLHLK
ncbi:uncharacterized protein FOMMEDRAFT_156797 [Fomitiporia mediterranea MF3/22]|uniref:uncharacterized protein n=1 Tax=Fomitiporia mediterranea (strain MF3/22) TaxID=694068 RepID=UPI0004409058|nr:uncharacterized protein FOMMEDRAFT_156797 [Fomitiporia mediterranea MF3/22]EJD03394.1 hypothetical protein FOMMEDRAFT_156797 [Fomitiporia mediterranea MF3/22]